MAQEAGGAKAQPQRDDVRAVFFQRSSRTCNGLRSARCEGLGQSARSA